jgi:hypothetical protein
MSPTSPSVASRASEDAPRSATTFAPRRADTDGDGYEDGEPGPMPDPGTVPPPEGMPVPDGIPVPPVQLTISVVGLLGNLSFAPSPLQAAIGNTIIWTNNDVLPHDIVLDDGTPVGNLSPGQSSLPFSLAVETVSYHCTIHPSMTGQIVPVMAVPTGEPLPSDPSQMPAPDPYGAPAPDPYGDDGYEDDYY